MIDHVSSTGFPVNVNVQVHAMTLYVIAFAVFTCVLSAFLVHAFASFFAQRQRLESTSVDQRRDQRHDQRHDQLSEWSTPRPHKPVRAPRPHKTVRTQLPFDRRIDEWQHTLLHAPPLTGGPSIKYSWDPAYVYSAKSILEHRITGRTREPKRHLCI